MRIGLCSRPFPLPVRCHSRYDTTRATRQQHIRTTSSYANARGGLEEQRRHVMNNKRFRPRKKKIFGYDTPEATFARHVLRSILRECTYFPDSFAADYIKRHALSRFRTNEYKAWENGEQFQSRSQLRRKEARSVISTLQRANEGQRSCLLKVLNMAYGRTGRRRHELMKPLLYVEGQNEILNAAMSPGMAESGEDYSPFDASNGRRPATATNKSSKLSPKTPLDLTPQLRALLMSQIQAKPLNTVRHNPKTIEPKIPELNSWLRPMPQNRIRNIRKKQYAMLLDRVQAPLPTEEWERLRELASGRARLERPGPKRTMAAAHSGKDETANESQREKSALELVARYGRVPKKAFGCRTVDWIKDRFMQRLYAKVFVQCPFIEWDSTKEAWKVTWGSHALLASEIEDFTTADAATTSEVE